ncbi:MAG: tetratricopeptide repeat protein [Anaerolineae bacterium]|nr:tetratricopeptide repeat protein [Anaerolineae bacterium]
MKPRSPPAPIALIGRGPLRVRLFGGLALTWGEMSLPPIPSLPARSLFAYLITHRDRPHTRDLLAGLFWPDLPDAQARRRLSQALWQIGRALNPLPSPAPYLLADADTVQFNTAAPYWLDVEEFGRLVDWDSGRLVDGETGRLVDGETGRLVDWETGRLGDRSCSQRTGPPAYQFTSLPRYQSTSLPRYQSTDIPTLRAAVDLYRGDFLAGFYDDWMIGERERLRELFLAALGRLTVLCKEAGAHEEALSYAQRLVAEDPLHEEGHREVMRLCHLLGRGNEALQQYELCRAVLAEELGAEPSAATTALFHEIAAGHEAEAPYLPQIPRPQGAPIFEGAGLAPLVGRADERTALLGHLERAIGGHGGLVLLEGEAGVGKTRLLQEAARDAGWRGMQVLRGRGRELADAPPYGPLVEALAGGLSPLRVGQLACLAEEEWLHEAGQLLPELGSVRRPSDRPTPDGWAETRGPGTTLPADQARARLLEALGHVVSALGQIVPHLLILEDLHWADGTTLDALIHLAPRLAASRVSVIASYRSNEARATPAVWEALCALDRMGWPRIELAPLTAGETGELVRRGLGLFQAAPHFEKRLYRETEGNPLFVLETLRSLHDEGLLYRDRSGEWSTPWDETTVDYAELPLPAGVHQVIAGRLARLGTDERAALNAAAVLGTEFDLELLLATSEQEGRACLAAAGELVRRRFLIETPQAYRFSHDLVRRVTYAGMSEAGRRRLHRRAGEALETLRPGHIEALAHHFTQAQAADKALTYNMRAGDRARAVYAGAEAIGYYERALAAWGCLQPPDLASGIGLHQARGETCQETGRFDQAEAAFRAAHALAIQTGDQLAQAKALNSLSYLCFQRGDYRSATEIARQALGLAASEAPHQMASALLNQANALRNQGNPRRAIELYEQAAALFEALGDRSRLADCLCRMGYADLFLGRYVEAQDVIERSLALRRQLDDRVGVSYSLTNLTAVCYVRGEFGRARATAQEALDIATAIGDPYGQDAALFNVGVTLLDQGVPAQAVPLIEQALALARQIGDRPLEAEALAELGRACAGLGDGERARAMLEQALRALAAGGECWHWAKTHAYLARVCLAAGDRDQALAQAHSGLAVAQRLADPWALGLTHRVMAEVAAHCGSETDVIRSHFEESMRLLREIGANAELARTLAAGGRYLAGRADADAACRGAAWVEEARSLFQQLGMAGDLACLDQDVTSRLPADRVKVRLPRAGVPTGRPLREDEWVTVAWTLAAPTDDAIAGKTPRRQHRLLRLLREAEAQGAAPTVDDLAAALQVSRATLKRDLATLRATGQAAHTRGSRS